MQWINEITCTFFHTRFFLFYILTVDRERIHTLYVFHLLLSSQLLYNATKSYFFECTKKICDRIRVLSQKLE